MTYQDAMWQDMINYLSGDLVDSVKLDNTEDTCTHVETYLFQ